MGGLANEGITMGKRYKLIKDLPHVKAGARCHLSPKGNLVTDSGVMLYYKNQLKNFPNILKDWFEEIPEKPKTVDDLKEGDTWFFINHSTDQCYIPETTNLICIDAFKQIGNAFLTREEAEKVLARLKAKAILERDTKGFKAINGGSYYQVTYRSGINRLLPVYYNGFYLYGGIKFATEEDAQESIRKHQDEWKTYLGVEE